MDFNGILDDLTSNKLAGRKYEKSGHGKFRDCVTVRRDGQLTFERFNYGEAAGLVCKLTSKGLGENGEIIWDFESSSYSGKEDAPARLTGAEDGALLFDDKAVKWLPEQDYKTMPGMGVFKKLFGKK